MIDRIIEFSARNKYLVIIFTLVAIVGAYHWMRQVPLDAIPDLRTRRSSSTPAGTAAPTSSRTR